MKVHSTTSTYLCSAYVNNATYRRSGNFRIIKFSCFNFRIKYFRGWDYPRKCFTIRQLLLFVGKYISCFYFRGSHRPRRYFYNESFQIYGMYFYCTSLQFLLSIKHVCICVHVSFCLGQSIASKYMYILRNNVKVYMSNWNAHIFNDYRYHGCTIVLKLTTTRVESFSSLPHVRHLFKCTFSRIERITIVSIYVHTLTL